MKELVELLVRQLGVSEDQATGGAGVLLRAARAKLGAGRYDELLGSLGGLEDLVRRAPGSGGGLGGLLSGVASALGGSRAALLADIVSGFTRLGLQPEQARQFVPVILEFLRSRIGGPAAEELEKKLRDGL